MYEGPVPNFWLIRHTTRHLPAGRQDPSARKKRSSLLSAKKRGRLLRHEQHVDSAIRHTAWRISPFAEKLLTAEKKEVRDRVGIWWPRTSAGESRPVSLACRVLYSCALPCQSYARTFFDPLHEPGSCNRFFQRQFFNDRKRSLKTSPVLDKDAIRIRLKPQKRTSFA